MTNAIVRHPKDWTSSAYAYSLAWGIPIAVIIAGFFLAPAMRTVLWVSALAWMGIACLWNARRCGRTHCRYTAPFYLVMIVPVLALGTGIVSFGAYDWLILALFILVGGKAIWWATEWAWGRYS